VNAPHVLSLSLAALATVAGSSRYARQNGAPPTGATLVVLGTGTPNADPDRSGPALAVVINDASYLVDAGPGIVRRAAAAQRGRRHR
jgi:hypothetical protein